MMVLVITCLPLFGQSVATSGAAGTVAAYLGVTQNAKKSGKTGLGVQLDWSPLFSNQFAYGFSVAYNRIYENMNDHRYIYVPTDLDNQTVYNANHVHIYQKTYDNIRLNATGRFYFNSELFSPYLTGGAGLSFSSVKESSSAVIVRTYSSMDDIPDYYSTSKDEKDQFMKVVFLAGAGLQFDISQRYSLDLQYQYIIHSGLFDQHFIALGLTI